MTITSQGVRAVYVGSGSTGPFTLQDADASAILFAANAEIVATRFDVNDVPDVLTIITDYTLTGAGAATAGALTLVLALAVGETLVIQRVTPKTQVIDLISGGRLSNATMEGFYDKIIRITQDIADGVTRSVKMPSSYVDDEIDFPVPEPDFYIGWDSDGLLENKTPPAAFVSGSGVPAGSLGNNGDYYLNLLTDDLYFKANDAWSIVASLRGAAGTAATVAVGTVTTGAAGSSATITNVGSSLAAVFNFTIPRGDTGVSGNGSGDVVGPASSVNGRVPIFSGTTGKLIADGGTLLSDLLTSAAAAAAYQPLDADLTSIAALTTTATGRSLLAIANAAAGRTILDAAISTVGQGKHTIFVPASAMYKTTAAGGPSSGQLSASALTAAYLAFDPGSIEDAHAIIAMPKSWDLGAITAKFYWQHPATTTNFTVAWTIYAKSYGDGEALNGTSYAGGVTINDTGGTTDTSYISAEGGSFTPAGTPVAMDPLHFIFRRLATDGSDTLAVDAYLYGVQIYFTTNAATDA